MQTARNACHMGGMKGRENGMVKIIIPRDVAWEEVTSHDLSNLNAGGVNAPKGMRIVEIERKK